MARFRMELGAEPRKVAILLGLVALAAFLYFTGFGDDPPAPSSPRSQPPKASAPALPSLPQALSRQALERELSAPPRSGKKTQRQEFRPSLKAAAESERDLVEVDPTLRVDLLAKLAGVTFRTGGRSMFEFGPDLAEVRGALPEPKVKIKPPPQMIGPEPPPPPPAPPVKPPPPPINLKFYGAALPVGNGAKRVFCMQGEEILTPAEGDVIQKRYRIVRINPASVLVEDLEHQHQQTIPIDELPKG